MSETLHLANCNGNYNKISSATVKFRIMHLAVIVIASTKCTYIIIENELDTCKPCMPVIIEKILIMQYAYFSITKDPTNTL